MRGPARFYGRFGARLRGGLAGASSAAWSTSVDTLPAYGRAPVDGEQLCKHHLVKATQLRQQGEEISRSEAIWRTAR
jgi:hypothetical protein